MAFLNSTNIDYTWQIIDFLLIQAQDDAASMKLKEELSFIDDHLFNLSSSQEDKAKNKDHECDSVLPPVTKMKNKSY